MIIVTVTTIINICMVSAFNLLPIAEMIVRGCQTGSWHRELPYQIWFPWDPQAGWYYPLMYAFQIYSGLIVVIGNVVRYFEIFTFKILPNVQILGIRLHFLYDCGPYFSTVELFEQIL